ncbi:MAG: hypothetical protein WBF90_01315 [Rivularia sp. (in: cyanobacteria)]
MGRWVLWWLIALANNQILKVELSRISHGLTRICSCFDVDIKDEQVYVNNQLLDDTYIEFVLDEFKEYGWNNPQVIPPNYFILRTVSNEENKTGLRIIQGENIIGQITMRFYPFNRIGSVG